MSLIAQYKLDGQNKNIVNRNYLPAVNVGGTTNESVSPFTQHAVFDGVDSTVNFGVGSDLFPKPQLSVSIWFRSLGTVPTTGTSPGIFSLTYGFTCLIAGDGGVRLRVDNGVDFGYLFSQAGKDYRDSNWHHLAVTVTDGEAAMYIDGVLQGTLATTWLGETRWASDDLNIGRDNNNTNYYFYGDLADFRIYDHVLTQREVKSLSQGLVTHLSTNNSFPVDAAGLSQFTEANSPNYSSDSIVGERCFEQSATNNSYLRSQNPPRVTGNQTLAMWLYPTDVAFGRQNPWNQAYGGEGTITQEPDGKFTFYYGTSGANTSPFQGFRTVNSAAVDNEWVHVALVRDFDNATLRWYINGELSNSDTAAYAEAAASTLDLFIGIGYTTEYRGKIADARQYATALSAEDVKELYQQGASIDNKGRVHSKFIAESGVVNPNILDYATWTAGTTGSQPGFNPNGSAAENALILEQDPFGKSVPIWEGRPDGGNDADGGFSTDRFPIDNTKLYRYSIWFRQNAPGDGRFYLGAYNSDATPTNIPLYDLSNGNGSTNLYFEVSPPGGYGTTDWYLVVAHIHPFDTAVGTPVHPDTGVYRLDGKTGEFVQDAIWNTDAEFARFRSYLYYSTGTSQRQQFVYPRVDVVDGTEPSLNALLSGFDSVNFERTVNELGSASVQDSFSVKYGKTNIGQINELGVTRGLVSSLPLNGDARDKVTGKNATVIGGATPGVEGFDFDGTGRLEMPTPIPTTGSQSWTASAWVYIPDNTVQSQYFINGWNRDLFFTYVDRQKGLLYLNSGDNDSYVYSSITPENRWLHVTYVYNQADLRCQIYFDGALDQSSVNLDVNDVPAGIGPLTVIGRNLQGKLRDIKLHDVDLTSEEIALEFQRGNAMLNKGTAHAKEFIEV